MQQRVLVRARNLATFRRALYDRATRGGPLAARRRVVIVPTHAAGQLLRQSIERRALALGRQAVVLPELWTRDDWLANLHQAAGGRSRWPSRLERHVVLDGALRHVLATRRFDRPPFEGRPGVVSALLDFHDELGRRGRSVRRMVRALFDELRTERGMDRGSEGLIDQARLIAFAFLAYRRALRASNALDEHELRRVVLSAQPRLSMDEVVVSVADHPADPRGLWPLDFDTLGRLTTLGAITVVMTDEAHDAGFRDRLEQELPGVREERAADEPDDSVLVGSPTMASPPVFVARDREDELADVAREVRARHLGPDGAPRGVAVVYHRPLPYLYLSAPVFDDALVPFRVLDALPLASEPFASVVDLLLAAGRGDGAAAVLTRLLRSPLVSVRLGGGDAATAADLGAFESLAGDDVHTASVSALLGAVRARVRTDRRVTDATRLAVERACEAWTIVADWSDRWAAARLAHERIDLLLAFLSTHLLTPGVDASAWGERAERARAAVLSVLGDVRESLRRHAVESWSTERLSALIRHAMSVRTFVPDAPAAATVILADAVAARFGDFDDVYLVGLVDTDWSDRPRRNIFFPPTLLAGLGWPQEADRARAERASFCDVLRLGRQRTRLSAFELDGDTLVGLSTMLTLATDLPRRDVDRLPAPLLFADERFAAGLDATAPGARVWADAKRRRPALRSEAYAGLVAPRVADTYRVSRVDRYVSCPFKYFAEHVLALAERRAPTSGLDPLERGSLLHRILEEFYRRWQASGQGAITVVNLAEAEDLFAAIADEETAELAPADRALERMRLVGSLVAPGVADRVFDLEVAAAADVATRLIEVPIEGTFTFPFQHGLSQRQIAVRGKADRIDVLADGSLRVIDYKLGRMPDPSTSVQIGVYAHTARQQLQAADGRIHPIASAAYLAFGDDRRLEGRLTGDVEAAVLERAERFARAVDAIEGGQFPPRPSVPSDCLWCGFATVCRKEYRLETDDDAAEPV